MISITKTHMSNQITIVGLSSNLEESIRVYPDQVREINPSPSNNGKVRVCRVRQKENHNRGNKKQLILWGKSKHVVVDVIIIYGGKHKFVICQTCFESKYNDHINTVSAYIL